MRKMAICAAGLALLLAGCLQTETKIKVDRNGAGTIERTVVLRSDVVEMMQSMQAFDPAKKDAGVFDEAKLRKDAANLGEGVQFVSASAIRNRMGEGYKVVYSFKDISRIRVNQTPGNDLPNTGMGSEGPGGSEEYLTFSFTKGNPARLQIRLYQGDEKETGGEKTGEWEEVEESEDEDEEEEDPAMDAEMLKQFYGDMKLLLTVETGSSIVDTNADYRAGTTITLMDMDFGALIRNPEAFEILTRNKIQTLEQMKEFSRKYPGIRLETKEEVAVRFR